MSLESSARLDFSRRGERFAPVLLAFSGDPYEGLEHSIAAATRDVFRELVSNREATGGALGDARATRSA